MREIKQLEELVAMKSPVFEAEHAMDERGRR